MAIEIRELNEDENKAFSRMQQTIRTKQHRNKLKVQYADAKKRLDNIGFSVPDSMTDFQIAIGWADKAGKVPARRIRPDGFSLNRKSTLLDEVEEIMHDHHTASMERMAIESSLELATAFVFVSKGDPDKNEPKVILTARTALEATAEVDPRTGRTILALENVDKQTWLFYLPGVTHKIELDNGKYKITDSYPTYPGKVMATPYVWGKSLRRNFGRSRITRPLMGYVDTAVRTMLRQEVSAEFFSSPQRALMGADDAHFRDSKGNRIDPLTALIGGIWALPDIRDDETGDLVRAKLEQFSQQSFLPHSEMMRNLSMQVSSETNIPVAYLGVVQDNPSSADAIRANEADLISVITYELDSYGFARVDVARNVATVLQGEWTEGMERELRGLEANFRDPGTVTKSEQSDAGLKYKSAFPEGDPEVAMEIFGLSRMQIERNKRYMQEQRSRQLMEALLSRQPAANPAQPGQEQPPANQPAPANAAVQ